MNEEEDYEECSCYEMRYFEKLIVSSPEWTQGRKCQPSLRENGDYTGPVHYHCIPHLHHVALPKVKHNERECMNESKSKHGIGGPLVIDLEFFVRNAGQDGDQVLFRPQSSIKLSGWFMWYSVHSQDER
jgi:hypothetical protein